MKKNLNRRKALRLSLLAGIGMIGFGKLKPANALNQPNINQGIEEFTMAMSWPKASPGPALAAQYFADQLLKSSEGKLQVKIFGAGEMVPGFEVFDAVASGVVDMAHTASFYWQGKMPAAVFFTTIPFGLSANEHQAWLHQGGGNELWQALYQPFGLLPMAAGNTGMSMAGWFKDPVLGLEDLKGRKIRMAGMGAEIFRSLGAQPINLPPAEISPALASGLVDGVEFLGPWMDSGFGFQKFAKYYYGSGFNKPNGTSELLISLKRFEKLSASQQALIRTVAIATHDQALAMADWQNGVYLNQFSNQVQIAKFPDAIKQAAQRIAPDILRNTIGEGQESLKILQSYQSALNILRPWSVNSKI